MKYRRAIYLLFALTLTLSLAACSKSNNGSGGSTSGSGSVSGNNAQGNGNAQWPLSGTNPVINPPAKTITDLWLVPDQGYNGLFFTCLNMSKAEADRYLENLPAIITWNGREWSCGGSAEQDGQNIKFIIGFNDLTTDFRYMQ